MRKYEIMYILRSNLEQEAIKAEVEDLYWNKLEQQINLEELL